MDPDGQPASVLVAVPAGCTLSGMGVKAYLSAGAEKIANNMAGISTNNGGTFPFFMGLANVNFYTDETGTTGKAYATNNPIAGLRMASTSTMGRASCSMA